MVPEDFYEMLPRLVAEDEGYNELFREQQSLDIVCSDVLSKLEEKDREQIIRYILLREKLGYQAARLAASHYARNGAKGFIG